MNREIKFFPAFDRTNPDPSKNYGVGCLEIRFLVSDEKGMVELQVLTQWYQEHVMKRRLNALKRDVFLGKEEYIIRHFLEPNPIDLCYYSLERISEDDAFFESGVRYFQDGKPCYYGYKYMDEDGIISKEVAFMFLVEKGDEDMWEYLEGYHREVFGK